MSPSVLLQEPASDDVSTMAKSTPVVSVKNLEMDEPSLLHRSLLERPHIVARASGSYLHLDDGREILDACGGAAVAVIGHGNVEVTRAVMEQMQRVSYVHTLSYGTESSEELARCVLRRGTFEHGLTKAFFLGSGSEANDAAMKCARQYWFEKGQPQKRYYIARRHSYHGNTVGSMSISDMLGRKIPYQDTLLPNISFVGPADAYHRQRENETAESYVQRLIEELEGEILRLGPENIISFIGETVSGAALGTMAAPAGYWPSVRAVCDKYDILLHLDEVMCGTGRTGSYFAFEQEGIRPDIVTVGKGLGGGYIPIAGMLLSDKVVDGLRSGTSAFNHGQTYQAHPVSCAAALAVQKILNRDGLIARVNIQGRKLESMLREAFSHCTYVGDIRGRGLFWTLEFVRDRKSKTPFSRSDNFGPRIQRAAFDLGVAFYPGAGTVDGVLGDHVTIAPPYTISDAELETSISVLKKAYDTIAGSFA